MQPFNGNDMLFSDVNNPQHREFGASGFYVQIRATIRRQLIQKRRKWGTSAWEIALPLLFVLGLSMIAAAPAQKNVPAAEYIGPNGPWQVGRDIRSRMCFADNATADLANLLQPCHAAAPNGVYWCIPRSAEVPVDGLCIVGDDPLSFQDFALSFAESSIDVEIPNHDDYILFKWAVCAVVPQPQGLFSGAISKARQPGSIYVMPPTGAGPAFVSYMNATYPLFKHVFGGYFENRGAAMPFVKDRHNEGKVWALIEVSEAGSTEVNSPAKGSFAFTIGMNNTAQQPIRDGIRDDGNGLGGKSYTSYMVSGALTLQKAVSEYYLNGILHATAADDFPNTVDSHLVIAPMPTSPYVDDQFLAQAGQMGPLLLVLAFLYPVSQLAKRLVEEKEQRLREGTMIMGLSKAAFFSSWLIVYYVQMLPTSFIITIVLKAGIMKQSNFMLIWILYLFFALTTVNLAALLSTFFSKAKIAALCVPLLYFVFAIPAFALPDTAGAGAFASLGIFCPVPLSVALKLIFKHEINDGMGWNGASSSLDKPFSYSICILFFVIDFFLYIGLMLYFDLVIPKDWGTTLHPFFCFKKASVTAADEDRVLSVPIPVPEGAVDNPRNNIRRQLSQHCVLQDYPSPNSASSVHIRQLRKEFPGAGGRVNVAVDGMELRLFPDAITVFLGHNGAGKTTVMNMMTGMMSPTSGDVTIYGNSILTNMQAIRRDIGFCPQHNILWDDLTCMEHLQYFAQLKGMTGSDVDEEALEMLGKVDLLDKRDVFSCNLSGGQKRKLSVAIAFMGRARLVLLDEPTAGMDVAARRHTWDVLKEMSKGRTILLTTHFMDEADLLGSRIAIMSKGSLHSYGTPMYLKNNLGSGYVMRIASPVMIADPNMILREVQRVLPKATIREAKGQELAVALPKDDVRLFPQAIRSMDSSVVKKQLNISSVSVSVASLEDVFLAIAHQESLNGRTEEEFAAQDDAEAKKAFEALERVYVKLQQQQQTLSSGTSAIEMQNRNFRSSQGLSMGSNGSFSRQLKGMLMKRFNHGRRDRCALCLQIIAPVLCVIMAMVLNKIPSDLDPEETWYANGMYGDIGQMTAGNNDAPIHPFFDSDFTTVEQTNWANTSEFSSFLLKTAKHHGDVERMVAFSCNDTNTNTVMLVNTSSRLSAPQALTQLYRAKIKAFTGAAKTIFTAQYPLPYTDRQNTQLETGQAVMTALMILIPFTFIPSTFVAYVVRERECKSKHLQFVSGASYTAYWLGNFLFDLASYLVTITTTIIIFAIFGQDWAVGTANALFGTIFLFVLYGLSGIGFAYLVSFLFDVHSTAQTVIMMVNFLVGFLLVLLMFFLRIFSTKTVGDILAFVLMAAPPFALGDGLFKMVLVNSMSAIEGEKSCFSADVAGYHMLYMGVLSVVFLAITMIIDHPSRAKRRAMLSFNAKDKAPLVATEDEDVARERDEVESGKRPDDVVQVQGLRKEFNLGGGKQKVAVQNITFGVKPGEVFGFLGTNGAGKTTTMSMLTTEIIPTCGNGRIGGFDIVQDSDKTRRLIGYCPQFDAIMDLLTPAEHLRLFSSLRGIPSEDTDEVIEALINSCALQKYRDIPAGSLSGGNKRKLSVAMALIGGPSIVFLDEPSAGMDPHARRQMWDVIIFVAKHSSVVLTTHHLEEVDVLAHRVGIMDAGLMKCLGSLEHLKVKFGSGFELTIQVSETGLKSATDFIAARYPAAVQVEARQQRILYTLPFESTDLASLFETIQRATDDTSIGIVDYTVQQTSLEQVFMRISGIDEGDEATAADDLPVLPTPGPDRLSATSERETLRRASMFDSRNNRTAFGYL